MQSVVATRYAKALVDVVVSHADLDSRKILAQLREVESLIQGNDDLANALSSPAVPPSRKRAVMHRLLEPMGIDARVRNFIYVVIDHRRAADLPSIVDTFEVLLDERLGFVAADVRSAQELDDSQKARLQAQIARIAGKNARLKFSTDPSLIGGVIARVGSTVYDGSVRGQLDRLRTSLGAS